MTTLLEDTADATVVEAALRALHPAPTRPRGAVAPAPAGHAAAHPTRGRRAAERPPAAPRLRLVPALPVAPGPRAEARLTPPPPVAERVRLVASDRALVVESADEGPGPAPDVDATRFAHGVGLACVEVVLGRRPAAQLARWLTPGVLVAVQERAALTRRAAGPAAARARVRRVRVCQLDDRTAEACLVVDDGSRVRAVALRLEAHRAAWRVTTLEIG
ncbi:energy transducer TonB [Cellulomonas sp. JZ18]|uniref:Rv3235 family protein n=1 Tax=Cellulomonas sp. JZ18 TaxID=2654191 RepID=UPI0012D3BD5F|nr:Rv3235 family protein [Cellulomonas sp. JZ18]QGQ18914.1 energy transducer TonB [Cellulomonas sp. JZ18]